MEAVWKCTVAVVLQIRDVMRLMLGVYHDQEVTPLSLKIPSEPVCDVSIPG